MEPEKTSINKISEPKELLRENQQLKERINQLEKELETFRLKVQSEEVLLRKIKNHQDYIKELVSIHHTEGIISVERVSFCSECDKITDDEGCCNKNCREFEKAICESCRENNNKVRICKKCRHYYCKYCYCKCFDDKGNRK